MSLKCALCLWEFSWKSHVAAQVVQILHKAEFHLGLHCMLKYLMIVIQNKKGYLSTDLYVVVTQKNRYSALK